MSRTLPSAEARSYARLLATNATDSSFAARIPTTTTPAAAGVITLAAVGQPGPGELCLLFYGVGADNTTFDARVIGWRPAVVDGSTTLWVHDLIAQVQLIISTTQLGVAGTGVTASNFFCDTATLANGIAVCDNPVANSSPASVTVGVEGYPLVEVLFDMTGATSGNALWAAY